MQNAMYSALFGALSNEFRMNSIANNLANVNTTGYKRDVLAFKDTMQMFAVDYIMEPVASIRSKTLLPDPQHIARTRLALSSTDFQQGGLKPTNGPLDVAISGAGFFKVESPDGVYYTRNGHFTVNQEGTVVTEQGWPVMSEGGPITLPEGYKNITIAEDGRIFADGTEAGQLLFVTVDNPLYLEKQGNNLFRPRPGVEIQEEVADPAYSWLAQGFLESANVEPVYEMVNMIETQRQYEAYQKLMQTSDTLDREAYSKVGRPRT